MAFGSRNLSAKRSSFLPQVPSVPERVKQRVPDTDHLAKMRNYLVGIHQSDSLVRELSENGALIPTAIKMKLEKRKETEAELGESFFDLIARNNREMESSAKIKDLMDQGLPQEFEGPFKGMPPVDDYESSEEEEK
jgi:hypothetical protein